MPQINASAMPIIGQPYRMPVSILNTSDKVVTGLAGIVCTLTSPDGSADVSSSTAGLPNPVPVPVEIGASGKAWLDIPAYYMNTTCVIVKVTVTNANAQDFLAAVFTVPAPTEATVSLDPPQLLMLTRLWMYENYPKKDDGTTFAILTPDESAVIAQCPVSYKGGVNYMGALAWAAGY